MGSEMQQVFTAGFEHTQAGTAETRLAKEILYLAAFSQIKLLSPFLGREGARRGNETPRRAYSKVFIPRWGLPEVPWAEVSAPGLCPEFFVTALSRDRGSRQCLEQGPVQHLGSREGREGVMGVS